MDCACCDHAWARGGEAQRAEALGARRRAQRAEAAARHHGMS